MVLAVEQAGSLLNQLEWYHEFTPVSIYMETGFFNCPPPAADSDSPYQNQSGYLKKGDMRVMGRKIVVLDTTLRDGEQVPGAKLNLQEKLRIAQQLKTLKVDIIEAGFPISSQGDFEAVRRIAKEVVDGPVITALARAVKADIDAVYESVKEAQKPLIHIVLGVSDSHIQAKLRKSKEAIMQMGIDAVKYAKTLLPEVQYSTEDATRADFEYLWQTIEAAVKAGATIINVPDTVGYAVPEEFGELIRKLNYRLKNTNDKVLLSVHCHNDTGLATANTLAAVKNGADKVECTLNGIGERAGNAALEEVVVGIRLRADYYGAYTDIATKEIKATSTLVSNLMGLEVQVNKAVTGDNAFAHSSGIHQDGLLKDRGTYEILRPEDVGVESMELILTARSGRHAFKSAITPFLPGQPSEADFEQLFARFLELADMKKEIYNHDLYHIAEAYYAAREDNPYAGAESLYELQTLQVVSNDIFPSASVKIRCGNQVFKDSAVGDGPIDALYKAINQVVKLDVQLLEYKISSISKGNEALGRVHLKISHNGVIHSGKAVDTDIIKASAEAYLSALNQVLLESWKAERTAVQ